LGLVERLDHLEWRPVKEVIAYLTPLHQKAVGAEQQQVQTHQPEVVVLEVADLGRR
jgi:hypothetical protein